MLNALWYLAPHLAELREEVLPPLPQGAVQVRTLFSAISRGTESLIYQGLVPATEFTRMRAPNMAGDFPYPVKYGYANVGRIEDGPAALIGQIVFGLHPHQTFYQALPETLVTVPPHIPPARAVLSANMETALNAVWDASPGPGDRITVVGGGVVGCLVAYLCGHLLGAEVTVVDINPARATIAQALGVSFALPADVPLNSDVVFHSSASAAGFATALLAAGDEATVLELSWYGSNSVNVPLGGAFHSRQIRLQASQVGHISASRRPRWSYHRRLKTAVHLLKDPRLDILLSPVTEFHQLVDHLPSLFHPSSTELCCLIHYS